MRMPIQETPAYENTVWLLKMRWAEHLQWADNPRRGPYYRGEFVFFPSFFFLSFKKEPW